MMPSEAARTGVSSPRFLDPRAILSDWELRRESESYADFQLLGRVKPRLRQRDFVDVGCGTGETYRYLRSSYPDLRYRGFDVSHSAVDGARFKYPGAGFDVCRQDLSDVASKLGAAGVVWCRDIVTYQEDPFGFIERLLRIPAEAYVLRLRTRDRGATVLDPDASCQRRGNAWVPYMILNTDELSAFLSGHREIGEITVVRHYALLGGIERRYLPKDCYLEETGTAETSVLLVRGSKDGVKPRILFEKRAHEGAQAPLWYRGMRFVKRRVTRPNGADSPRADMGQRNAVGTTGKASRAGKSEAGPW